MADDLFDGWMVLTERKGCTEALAKPIAEATNWEEAYAPIVKPTEKEAEDVVSASKKKAWAVPVTVRDNGKIVFRGNNDMIFTPEEIYRDAKMELPDFAQTARSGYRW